MSTVKSSEYRVNNLRKYFGRPDLSLEDLSTLTGVPIDKLLSTTPERFSSDYVHGFMNAEVFPLHIRLDVVPRWRYNAEYWIGVANYESKEIVDSQLNHKKQFLRGLEDAKFDRVYGYSDLIKDPTTTMGLLYKQGWFFAKDVSAKVQDDIICNMQRLIEQD